MRAKGSSFLSYSPLHDKMGSAESVSESKTQYLHASCVCGSDGVLDHPAGFGTGAGTEAGTETRRWPSLPCRKCGPEQMIQP